MKRLSVLLIILIFSMVGCGAKEPASVTIDRSFCCPVTVEQNGLHYEAELTVTPEQCAAIFSLPDVMNGMILTASGGRVSVRYGETKGEAALPTPQQCFLFWLDRALTQTEVAVTKKESTNILQGMVENRKYLLTVDKNSFEPLYFEMDALDLTIKFRNSE